MADLERLTVLIEANTRSYERSMLRLQSQTERAIRGAQKSINKLDGTLAKLTKTARAAAGAFGIGFGVTELASSIRGIVKDVADLGDAADRIGITADRLQELQYQAQQTGSSTEAMTDALEQFSKRLGEARQGSGALFDRLKANGVTLDEIAKMPVNDALKIFIDLIGNARDEAQALAIAAEGFGRGGAELALTFKDGADGAREFADQAHRTGQIIDNELVKSAQDIDDEFAQLTGTISTMIKSGLLEFLNTTAREIRGIGDAIEAVQSRRGPLPFAGTAHETPGMVSDRVNRTIDETFEEVEQLQQDAELLAALQKKLSIAPGGDTGLGTPSPTTRDPPAKADAASNKRAAAIEREAAAIEREKDQVVELIAELERERSLIGATDEERRISNELRDAGAVATEAQKQQIISLVTSIEAEEQALDDLISRMDTLRDAAGSAMDSFVQSLANAEDPMQALKAGLVDILQTIIRIAEQQAITRLFGAFGTAAPGILSGLPGIGSVAPAKAAAPASTNVHITAEPSPLLHLTITKSSQAAEERAIARGPVVARNNQMRYGIA